MLRFGICTREQYLRKGRLRRYSGARVSYSLLDIGEHPTSEQIQLFEDISFTLRTSNGIFRTTFRLRVRSLFELMPGACHVLRTMNILNKEYFSPEQLTAGVHAAFQSLKPKGIWIVGRTAEDDFSNHVTFFRRQEDGWEVLERIGKGSDIEDLVLHATVTNCDPIAS